MNTNKSSQMYFKKLPLFFSLLLFIASCTPKTDPTFSKQSAFSFSPNKIWAHRVNSFEELEKKHQLFEGMEIDLFYSNATHNFYVAHDEIDTLSKIILEEWIKKIPNPEKNWYWLDLKNLNKKNANVIASVLVDLLNKYGILNKTICENRNVKALAVLKSSGLAVSYWVNSDVTFRKFTGNALWKKRVAKNIAYLKPDALSSFWWMHPLLDSSFPDENISYWHLPDEGTPESIEFTKVLCRLSNVKVVLIDDDEPVAY